MPVGKRKLETFDPNKSDSDDVDYVSEREAPRRSRKSQGKKSSKRGTAPKRKRARYGGSDVDDDEQDDSLLEDSFSEPSSEEEIETDPITGRARRQVAKKPVKYEESDEDEIEESRSESEASDDASSKPASKPTLIITLKVPTDTSPEKARSTRAGSSTRGRGGLSAEPTSAVSATRRSTRAHTEEGDEPIALSNSGRHIIRESRSPEPIGRLGRPSRGSKGLKQPAPIREEIHETSSYEQQATQDVDNTVAEAELEVEADPDNEEDDADDKPRPIFDEDDEDEDAELPGFVKQDVAEDEDEDDVPVARRARGSRPSISAIAEEAPAEIAAVEEEQEESKGKRRLRTRAAGKASATGVDQTSDFEPMDESGEEDISGSETSPKKGGDDSTDSQDRRGRSKAKGKSKSTRSSRRRGSDDEEDEELDPDELMEEAEELRAGRRKRSIRRDQEIIYEQPSRRARKAVDYTIRPMDQIYAADEDAEEVIATPSRKAKRGGASQPWERNLYTTFGPFGGAGGPAPVIGGPWGTGTTGNVDSDSSDDENMARPTNLGGNVGMTPTSAMPAGLLPGMGQLNPADPVAAMGGTPSNLGKVKSQKALADADPLGVDQNVDFSKVGGLAGHIDQLKEMVQMPLLYPELFLKFHVTPPRGVLFHGPPGTGKTLLARALAASVGSEGRKITFYMRKGADALSKWVGEAERQLRLLFEEARKTQPSIIFFDEIDGLAPVRSSKQEQIHASIVSTLLALMDGMDGRGQVIVIGATNRPDNIDPALRRPGRFDREFYFPLPDIEGRKSIINIHTRDWGIDESFKASLAHITKGYGGADLRALCTEAALNAIQRTYPQIYSSNDKLIVDQDKIKITAKDFMLSIKKMIPSSERATSSGAAPLPKVVEPLLRDQLKALEDILDGLIPIKKKTTALQEALYEQYDDDDQGFGRETLQQEFEKSRVFRPRLLIEGLPGMGQGYIGSALLNHFEGLHVQNFDLPTIYSDSARSAEAAIVQLFQEVKRHKPSVIFLPGIDNWYHTLSDAVITTFMGLLRSIPPTDPVLVLGIADTEPAKATHAMLRDLFGFSKGNRFEILRPSQANREEFFKNIIAYVRKAPKDFPDPVNRKLRTLEVLKVAPPPPPKIPTKDELKAVKKRDHQLLNALKVLIQPIMDQIQKKYRKFRNPVLAQSMIQYLFDEQDPNHVQPDIATAQFRPFELEKNKDGVTGLRETSTGKFFFNLETTTIEERLSNGFYARPKDFLFDIRTLAKDAKNIGDKVRLLAANEMLANVEVDVAMIEANPTMADCDNVYLRQLQRAKEKAEKEKKRAQEEAGLDLLVRSDIPVPGHDYGDPITLGDAVPRVRPNTFVTPFTTPSSLSNGASAGHDSGASGAHPLSNGSSVPSHVTGEDVQMSGTDETSQRQGFDSQNMPPPTSQWSSKLSRGPSNLSNYPAGTNTQSQVSQHSGFQALPHDLSPGALVNYASTTTSGRKTTTDPSSKNTQSTNGHDLSDVSPINFGAMTGDSQLTNTQKLPNSQASPPDPPAGDSQEPWPESQAHALARGHLQPAYGSQPLDDGLSGSGTQIAPHGAGLPAKPPAAPLDAILNATEPAASEEKVVVDEEGLTKDLAFYVAKSSGCSIEQLEQINRELMDTLWKMRGEHNRVRVATEMKKVFNGVIADIHEMQKILKASQDEEEAHLGYVR